jgi:nucleotide-binding universal stress UspA family protein
MPDLDARGQNGGRGSDGNHFAQPDRPASSSIREHRVMSTLGTDPQSGSGRIVVGVDGSYCSEEALRWALGQAQLTGQPVEAVISWSIPVTYGGMGGSGAVAALDWEGDATSTLKDTVAKAVDSPGADRVSQRVVAGHPAQVLLDAVADADLLVVGSRGLGGFKGMLLGSVSQEVVSRAPCPVVVIRTPANPPA